MLITRHGLVIFVLHLEDAAQVVVRLGKTWVEGQSLPKAGRRLIQAALLDAGRSDTVVSLSKVWLDGQSTFTVSHRFR